MPRRWHAGLLWALLLGGTALPLYALDLSRLVLPPGFHASVFAEGLDEARQLAVGARGTVFAGSLRPGVVYALRDADGDGVAESVRVIARDLRFPTGVAVHDGALYVAEIDRILRYADIESHLEQPPAPTVFHTGLPRDTHHGFKTLAFAPDGALFTAVGMPCNVCEKPAPYGTLLRFPPAGGAPDVYARGVRNSVGFDWQPATGVLWFSDNGRDNLGDDAPPDELNRAPRSGLHFGFPYVHGGDIIDPEFGADHRAQDFTPPALRLGAHVAPLGIHFYRGTQFPSDYRGALFVAEHGSWNRSRKSGYRVMVARVRADGQVDDYRPFIEGWLDGEDNWGRPVAFAELADGSLLLSDDEAGVVYRIRYGDGR